jgi:hypothetical protein
MNLNGTSRAINECGQPALIRGMHPVYSKQEIINGLQSKDLQWIYRFFDSKYTKDREVVLIAMQSNSDYKFLFYKLDKQFRNDPEIAMIAVQANPRNIFWVGSDCKQMVSIILCSLGLQYELG